MIQNHSMRLHLTLGALAAVACASVSCGEEVRFPPRYYNLNETGLVQKADLIVIGRTTQVEWGQTPIRANWTGQPFLETARLVKLRVAVEATIRGTTESREVLVYCWVADAFTNAHSLNRPAIGERAVHYLVREKGAVRYVTDVIRSKTLVNSGEHRNAVFLGHDSAGGELLGFSLPRARSLIQRSLLPIWGRPYSGP